MENATRRIRKARRQGLARRAGAAPGAGTRAALGEPNRGKDLPHEPRGNERRKTLISGRKTKRTLRSTGTPPARQTVRKKK